MLQKTSNVIKILIRKDIGMTIIALRGKSGTGKSSLLKELISIFCKNDFFRKNDICVVECGILRPHIRNDSTNEINEAKKSIEKLILLNSDIYVVFKVKGKYIGIATQGDSRYYLEESLSKINKAIVNDGKDNGKCDIFICAVRTFGDTCKFVFDNSKNGELYFFDKATLFVGSTYCDTKGELICLRQRRYKLNYIQAKEITDLCIEVWKSIR